MESIEINKFRKGNRVNIEGIILRACALAGVVTIAVLAPNALQLLMYFDKERRRKKDPRYLVNEAIARLVRKKCVTVSKSGRVFLTKEGEKRLHMIEHGVYPFPKTKWDKKWRIVSFDVSEKRRKTRDQLRLLLRQVGFVRLQDSVWVYPYDVEDVVNLIKAGNFLEKEVLYMTVHATGKDTELKSYFKLS